MGIKMSHKRIKRKISELEDQEDQSDSDCIFLVTERSDGQYVDDNGNIVDESEFPDDGLIICLGQ
jgi:hypothetical protein